MMIKPLAMSCVSIGTLSKSEAIIDDPDQQHADHGHQHGAGPAHHACAAEDDGGNRVQLDAHAVGRRGRMDLRGLNDPGKAGAERANDVGEHFH